MGFEAIVPQHLTMPSSLSPSGFGPFYSHEWSLPVFISSAIAQTASAAASEGPSLWSQAPLLIGMLAMMYFLMIRPQQKKQKEQKAMIDAIAKGDEVITAGGMMGKITKKGDLYVDLEISTGVEVQMQLSAIIQVLPKGTIK